MYKILGKMAAEHPAIARPAAQITDIFFGIFLTVFKIEGKKIERYQWIKKGYSKEQGLQLLESIEKKMNPGHVLLMNYDGINPPEKIIERGDEEIVNIFLRDPWRRKYFYF